MKKLLLLAVLALGVVACDKNELGDIDSMSINPIEATVDVDLQVSFDNFIKLIEGMNIPKGVSSTNKGGDNGVNWLEITYFASGNEGYVYLRPEELGNGCYDGIHADSSNVVSEIYTYDASGDRLNIERNGTAQWFNVPSSLSSRIDGAFAISDSAIYFADYTSSWSVRFGATPSVTVND